MITMYKRICAWARARAATDGGASLVEYALLVALIAMVCFAAVAFFGDETSMTFSESASAVGATN